jgi:hypothetical protein
MSQVQSVLFDRALFTKAKATRWLRAHGFIVRRVDVTANRLRYRQVEPVAGSRYAIRHIKDGVELVIMY